MLFRFTVTPKHLWFLVEKCGKKQSQCQYLFVMCLSSVFHTHADWKCQRPSALQRHSLQTPQTAAHGSGECDVTVHVTFIQTWTQVSHICFSQARTVEEKKLWAHHIKRLILENHHAVIPQKVRKTSSTVVNVCVVVYNLFNMCCHLIFRPKMPY